jgi:adenylate cyclase
MSETRKLAAILVADVVGYSRLAGADEERTLARLRGLRSDLIDPAIAAHRGRVVKRTGDGSIIEFRSVVDAVRCAIEIQNGLIERNAGVPPERRIEFRVGIHLGDVVEESDGDLMGDGVNIAARLEGICEAGGICLSEDAYRQVRGRLDLAVSDLGPKELKNISEPVRVYSLEVGKPAQAKPATVMPRAKPREPAKPSRLALLSAAIAALVILASLAWYVPGANRFMPITSNALPPPAPRLSLVVLPFANLSGDPAQDYLADALTDELTTALARISGVFAIARNTALTYKGKPIDAKAIGKELGVRCVLEGSVQPSATQLRVNVQLIDADSGAHLWADQFDTPRSDLLQTQDEIVTRLARALDLQLTQVEAARLKRTPVANLDAEDLALQCESGVIRGGVFGKEAEAGYPLCERALALDPNNVRALIFLTIKYRLGIGLPERDLQRADELVSRALALDPNSAYAHEEKAWVLLDQGRLDEALAEAERAHSLDPANPYAYANMGEAFIALGRFEKALDFFDKAIRLSPHDPVLYYFYGAKARAYNELKQYDQAIEAARQAIAINPSSPLSGYAALGSAYVYTGQSDKSLETCDQAIRLFPRDPECYSDSSRAYYAMKQYDQAIEAARRAIAIDPSASFSGYAALGEAYFLTGQFEKSLESCDQAIRLSPRDPECYHVSASAYFAMKQYDQAIERARRTMAVASDDQWAHADIIAALALTGREADAREALQRFLALPPGADRMRTIAAWKAFQDPRVGPHSDPAVADFQNRRIDGLRKAGMPEQ